eukprot:TRINITY_DN58814_c0_g1_i1.p1 TRINITY_DN58814_c0_g1~~TRINITY_DN58814_c0_g1_i1.p1  ORF type:complete len:324 (-),score=46.33 TRINITY_DN58814_c0_g1_i1:63-1034(-)
MSSTSAMKPEKHETTAGGADPQSPVKELGATSAPTDNEKGSLRATALGKRPREDDEDEKARATAAPRRSENDSATAAASAVEKKNSDAGSPRGAAGGTVATPSSTQAAGAPRKLRPPPNPDDKDYTLRLYRSRVPKPLTAHPRAALRQALRDQLARGLALPSDANVAGDGKMNPPAIVAAEIEDFAYTKTVAPVSASNATDAIGQYHANMVRMVTALSADGNTLLRGQLLAGIRAPARLLAMTSGELRPPALRAACDVQRAKEEERAVHVEAGSYVIDKMVPCRGCKLLECVGLFQMQTRGGDEPATTFYKCFKCKKQWKDSN